MWHDGELSLAYLTVDGASAIEHVEVAAASGFQAAGLRILPPSHLPVDGSVVGDPQAIRRLRRVCRSLGVRPLDAEVMSLGADTSRGDIVAMVSTAEQLGFRYVQTVIDDTDLTRAADNLALLAEEAGDAGLGVALEFMAFRPLKNLAASLSLIEQSGSGNTAVLIDALHLARSGGTPDAVAAVPAGRIAMAQLCDAPADPPTDTPGGGALATEARCGRLFPGEGELRLDALIDVLPDRLPLSLEVPHPSFADKPFAERAQAAKAALDRFLGNRRERLRAGEDTHAAGVHAVQS